MRVEITFAGDSQAAVISAEQVSAALKSLGLTATTTSGQLKTMATSTDTLSVASTRAATAHRTHAKGINEAEKSARGAVGSFLSLGRAVTFASNAFLGGVLIGGTLKHIVDTTRAAETATAALRVAVTNTGASWNTYKQQTDRALSSQSELSKFTKTELTQALAKLVLSTGSVEKGEAALAVATNLARVAHEDLGRAETQLAMIQSGRLTTLRGLGISTIAVTTAQEALKAKLAELKANHEQVTQAEINHARAMAVASDRAATAAKMMDLVREKTQGADAAFAHSSAGHAAEFSRSLENITVAIGTGLMPEIDLLIGDLSRWLDHLVATGQAQKDAKEAADALKTTISVLSGVIKTADSVTGSFMHTIELLLAIKFATMMSGWASSLGTFIQGTATAEGKTGGLLVNMRNLARIGTLTIGITTLINGLQTPGPRGFLEQLFGAGAIGWALGGPYGAMATISLDVLYNLLKKPGGSGDPNNPTNPDYTYTIGRYKGYGVAVKGAPGDTNIGTLLKKADEGKKLTPYESQTLLAYARSHVNDGSFLGFKSFAQAQAFYKASNVYNLVKDPNATSPTAPGRGTGVGNVSASELSAGKRKLVAFARNALGKPYLWGGSGPSAFDCSGLVMWAFQNGLDIQLPHSTYEQVKMGTQVNPSKASVGDVVFTNYGEGGKAGPGHEGLIVGFTKDGQPIIEAAPHTGAKVQTYTGYGAFTGGKKFTVRDLIGSAGGAGGGGTGAGGGAGGAGAGWNPTPVPQAFELPKRLQLALAKASSTPGTGDDRVALRAAISWIRSNLSGFTQDQQIDAYIELAALLGQLKTVGKKVAAKTREFLPGAILEQIYRAQGTTATSADDAVAYKRAIARLQRELPHLHGAAHTAAEKELSGYQKKLGGLKPTGDELEQLQVVRGIVGRYGLARSLDLAQSKILGGPASKGVSVSMVQELQAALGINAPPHMRHAHAGQHTPPKAIIEIVLDDKMLAARVIHETDAIAIIHGKKTQRRIREGRH